MGIFDGRLPVDKQYRADIQFRHLRSSDLISEICVDRDLCSASMRIALLLLAQNKCARGDSFCVSLRRSRRAGTFGGNEFGVLMARLAGFTALEWNAMALAIAAQPTRSDAATPVLEWLRALARELSDGMVPGDDTEPALALLETAREIVRAACRSTNAAAQTGMVPGTTGKRSPAHGGWAGWQVRALDRDIDHQLDAKVSLTALAGGSV